MNIFYFVLLINFQDCHTKEIKTWTFILYPSSAEQNFGCFAEDNGNRRNRDKKCTKTEDGNERKRTNSHPNENPSFTLILSPCHVEGDNRLVRFLYFYFSSVIVIFVPNCVRGFHFTIGTDCIGTFKQISKCILC